LSLDQETVKAVAQGMKIFITQMILLLQINLTSCDAN